jgi:glycosyltransferase involved in cell wall biosynthesis
MSSQHKLLFLVPFPPRLDAVHGGGKSVAQLLWRLGADHRLAIVYLRTVGEPPLDARLRERCEIVEEVERPVAHSSIRKAKLLLSLIQGKPFWVADCASAGYTARLGRLLQRWQPDIIHIEYHVMGQYIRALEPTTAPRVLTEHEPAQRAGPYVSSRSYMGQLLNRFDKRVWAHFERSVIEQVQAVVVFTEADRLAVLGLVPRATVVRIPLGTDAPLQPLDPVGSYPPSMLFFGSFIHPPNVDAALRLVQFIFPKLRVRFPDLRLYIVGDQPPPRLSLLAGDGTIVTGRVSDLGPYLNGASVVVAPLRLGGGMRIKVLEALAAGKAVVASRRAVEGLELRDREEVWLAENDTEFCDGIAQLLDSTEARVNMARLARAWAIDNLDWNRSVAAFESLHVRLLEGHPGE